MFDLAPRDTPLELFSDIQFKDVAHKSAFEVSSQDDDGMTFLGYISCMVLSCGTELHHLLDRVQQAPLSLTYGNYGTKIREAGTVDCYIVFMLGAVVYVPPCSEMASVESPTTPPTPNSPGLLDDSDPDETGVEQRRRGIWQTRP